MIIYGKKILETSGFFFSVATPCWDAFGFVCRAV